MASRYSAARPKRAGEAFARSHHVEDNGDAVASSSAAEPSKKMKFDVRNPSKLAADAPEDDVVLEADVIGKGHGATKRGAVNIEGYDSDSDNENFDARARQRKTGDVNLLQQLDDYGGKDSAKPQPMDEDDEDDDMFADLGDEKEQKKEQDGGKKKKTVAFMDPKEIEGAVDASRSGGQVYLDRDSDSESETDDEKIDAAIAEQGLDDEVGRAGLKHHAPRLEAFNMKEEQEEGRFDEAGNYVRKAVDPDAVHDSWLEGLSKKEIKKAAEAHEKREKELRRARLEDDRVLTSELLTTLIINLERGETALEALARLGKRQKKGKTKEKKVPKWKQKKLQQQQQEPKDEGAMDVDEAKEEDPEQVRIKEAIDAITESADRLMGRDRPDIYDRERELLVREYRRETDEDWVEPEKKPEEIPAEEAPSSAATTKWEYRWTDGRDGGQNQGPYDGATMKAWQDAGYFTEGIEFRQAGTSGDWNRVVTFV